MDCSLSHWPSITQFDDFVWTGLGDIDTYCNFDKTRTDSSPEFPSIQHTSVSHQLDGSVPSTPASDVMFCRNDSPSTLSQAPQYYPVSSPGSLLVGKWENSVDLSNVLDNTFPSEGVTCNTTGEDAFDLYNDHILMQNNGNIGNDAAMFMDEPLSEVPDTMIATLTSTNLSSDLMTGFACDSTNLISNGQSAMECSNDVLDGNTSTASEPVTVSDMPERTDCVDHGRETCVIQNTNSNQTSTDAPEYYPVNTQTWPTTGDPCAVPESKNPAPLQQNCSTDAVLSSTVPQMPLMNGLNTSTGQNRNQTVVPIEDVYSGTVSPHMKLNEAARFISESKLRKAEVSRARRLAASQRRAEGRAKKYPLQKLIRMSSSTTCTRERLMNGSKPAWPSHVQMMPQTHVQANVPIGNQNMHQSSLAPVIPQAAKGFLAYSSHSQNSTTSSEEKASIATRDGYITTAQSTQDTRDAILLEELQNVLNKMHKETRLCIRDGFYRLAKSASQRQGSSSNVSDSCSSPKGTSESQTNSIDRWIVNLLYAKENEYSTITVNPQRSTDASWSSCGSFLNWQDNPCHTMTES